MKKVTSGFIFFIISISLLGLSGCQQERMTAQSDTTIPVRVTQVEKSSIQEFVTTTGTVYATKETILKTEQAGRYTIRRNPRTGKPFVMGDAVAANTLLFSLDNPEYVNQIAMDSKKLSLESAEREFSKQQSIYEKGGITLSEVKNAEKALIDARYSLDPTSRMFKIKIEASNPDFLLKSGMFVRADIIVQEKADVIVIPKDIILERRGRKTVYIVQRGIALERRLELGIETRDTVEVTEGLNPDDSLIIEGFETLRNRSRVKVLE